LSETKRHAENHFSLLQINLQNTKNDLASALRRLDERGQSSHNFPGNLGSAQQSHLFTDDSMEIQEVKVGKETKYYLKGDSIPSPQPEILRRKDGSLDCRSKFLRDNNIKNGVHVTKDGLPNMSYNENLRYRLNVHESNMKAGSNFSCFGQFN